MKIGIFDSGIGGTTIFAAIKNKLGETTHEYFYLADSKNCPYGEKSDAELYQIVTNNVNTLKNWGAKIIVIACNTATTKCIKKLRLDFPELSFVGTEPAIKLATREDAKNILVLATPGTIESERTAALVKANQKPSQNISLLACPGLADTIEQNLHQDNAKIDAKLTELFGAPNHHYDVIVLGCTHYPLIQEKLQEFFPGALLIDGSDGVANQVAKLIYSSYSLQCQSYFAKS